MGQPNWMGNRDDAIEQIQGDLRREAWRRFQLAYPTGTSEAFERAWPALRAGLIIERRRRLGESSAARAA